MSSDRSPDAITARAVIEAAQAATGLSLVRLAAALGVAPSTVHRWLSGAREMPGPAVRLCHLLRVSAEARHEIEHMPIAQSRGTG